MSRYIFLFALVASLKLSAQTFELGLIGGANLNLLNPKSKFELGEDLDYKPRVSFNIGAGLTAQKNRFRILQTIEYYRLINSEKNGYRMVDLNGSGVNIYDLSIVNHNVQLGTSGFFELFHNFYAGAGVALSYNIKSILILDENLLDREGKDFGKKFIVNSMSDYVFSVPITLSYSINKIDLMFTFNKGITNRVFSEKNYIIERDNTLILRVNYRFFSF